MLLLPNRFVDIGDSLTQLSFLQSIHELTHSSLVSPFFAEVLSPKIYLSFPSIHFVSPFYNSESESKKIPSLHK